MVTGVAANLVNALANYLFLYQMHLGVMCQGSRCQGSSGSKTKKY